MTTAEVLGMIGLFMTVVGAAIGFIMWLLRITASQQRDKTTTELSIKKLEAELVELRSIINSNEAKVNIQVETMRKENREDHCNLFNKIDEAIKIFIGMNK